MIHKIKIRALIYLILAHLGLIQSLIGLFLAEGLLVGSPAFWWLATGVGLIYGAILFSVLSVWIPLSPWIDRYQRTKAWHTWILQEIPTVLALIPVSLAMLRILKSSWSEIKKHHDEGELNVQTLAAVALNFAQAAEKLAERQEVDLIKKSLSR